MVDERVHPELRRVARLVPSLSIKPWSVGLVRRLGGLPIKGATPGVEVHDTLATMGSGGSVPVRVYLPAERSGPLATLLWIHGGGLIMGSHINDPLGAKFAGELGIAVVSAAYRLAPEHPYPAALDDLIAVAEWIRADPAALGLDPLRVAVGGGSAGGGLAAALTQRLHDAATPAAAQLLVYPMLDDRTAVRDDIGPKQHLLWNKTSDFTGWQAYLGTEPGSPLVPGGAVPARRTDLSGLAPAWIGVGTLDLFHDECLAYADRLREAGVDCQLEVVEGAIHGFDELARTTDIARRFLDAQSEFLRSVLLPG
ncbi:MAG: alpha/beta hydrolase [Microthrixaceae bacterium]